MGNAARQLLDRDFLHQQSFGDDGLERELLRLFEGQCHRLLPILEDRDGAPTTRLEAAHALKGAARAVGAAVVADLAHALEETLNAGRRDERLADELAEAIRDTAMLLAAGS